MATIDDIRRLLATETGLVTAAVTRDDGTPVLTVVNAGVLDHPISGVPSVGFVARGRSHKLKYLRRRLALTILVRRGWQWVAAEGDVDLIGPDDPHRGFDSGKLPGLIRAIYSAAGGEHENWDEFDRVMSVERRCAVLLSPKRIYTNPNRGV